MLLATSFDNCVIRSLFKHRSPLLQVAAKRTAMFMELYAAVSEGWIPESKVLDLMCTPSLISRSPRCGNGRSCLRCMLPRRPEARRFAEIQDIERCTIGAVREFLRGIPKKQMEIMTSKCWRSFYKDIIQYVATLDEEFLEELAMIGAGFYRESGVRQISLAGDFISYSLWLRRVDVFGAEIIVFKLVGDIEMKAAWQRARCPTQVRKHLGHMSTELQAYVMMAIKGLGHLGFMYDINAIEVWSRATVGNALTEDIEAFQEEAEESSTSDSTRSTHGLAWKGITDQEMRAFCQRVRSEHPQ